jgi:ATP-dependent Clp protease adaptor protein ClpS
MSILAAIYGPDSDIDELVLPLVDEEVDVGLLARVILYNDEEHTFEEVINQIVRAVGCSLAEAEAMTAEVHLYGKAMVFQGAMAECFRVSSVLEEIALHTQIEL